MEEKSIFAVCRSKNILPLKKTLLIPWISNGIILTTFK